MLDVTVKILRTYMGLIRIQSFIRSGWTVGDFHTR